jgi:hypothetical protein
MVKLQWLCDGGIIIYFDTKKKKVNRETLSKESGKCCGWMI